MKKFRFLILFLVLFIPLLVGCEPKRKELVFSGDDGLIIFNVKEDGNYTISTNKDDFRTSKEQAIIIGKDFKIGIEFDDGFDYFFKGDFDSVKEARKDNDDYKEVTYSDIKGIQYFYDGYMRYNVILPIDGNKKYYAVFSVYGSEDNRESAKDAINNEEVLDILNHITKIEVIE